MNDINWKNLHNLKFVFIFKDSKVLVKMTPYYNLIFEINIFIIFVC